MTGPPTVDSGTLSSAETRDACKTPGIALMPLPRPGEILGATLARLVETCGYPYRGIDT